MSGNPICSRKSEMPIDKQQITNDLAFEAESHKYAWFIPRFFSRPGRDQIEVGTGVTHGTSPGYSGFSDLKQEN